MSNSNSSKQILLYVIGIAILVVVVVGVTFAFFNYTRTGVANTIRTGQINFLTTQGTTVNLTDIFPVASNEVGNNNVMTLRIEGDTTYSGGEEFEITFESVNNVIGTSPNEVTIPINYIATYTPTSSGENIGSEATDYFSERGLTSTVYDLTETGVIETGKQVLVGFISANGEIDGTLTIKAYLDSSSVAITDTLEGTEEASAEYENGTPTQWVAGRTVLTTEEWNNLRDTGTPLSFKIKAVSQEGTWVEQQFPKGYALMMNAINTRGRANVSITDPADGTIYVSGSKDSESENYIDFNYVWYSGKLWRVTALYPDDETMKLVTENNITTISYNLSGNTKFYTNENTTSYMYQWLNEEFWPTLYNKENIVDTTKQWNATEVSSDFENRPLNTTMVSSNVGLLNAYEQSRSYSVLGTYSNGYLINNGRHFLLNSQSSSNVYKSFQDGYISNSVPTKGTGVRPAIYLKSNLQFSGSGTRSDPYRIIGDKKTGKENELVNKRLSGEYVKFNGDNTLYRIIEINETNDVVKTKIISMSVLSDDQLKYALNSNNGDRGTIFGDDYSSQEGTWYYYFNGSDGNGGEWYNNLSIANKDNIFVKGPYYLGKVQNGQSYKNAITNYPKQFLIGFPRYGEMFATDNTSYNLNNETFLITPRGNYGAMNGIFEFGDLSGSFSTSSGNEYRVRPTLYLSSDVKILSGTGLENDPYVLGI